MTAREAELLAALKALLAVVEETTNRGNGNAARNARRLIRSIEKH